MPFSRQLEHLSVLAIQKSAPGNVSGLNESSTREPQVIKVGGVLPGKHSRIHRADKMGKDLRGTGSLCFSVCTAPSTRGPVLGAAVIGMVCDNEKG